MSKVTHLRDLLEISGAQLESGVNLAERDKPSRRLTGFVFTQAAEEVNKALASVDLPHALAQGWAKSRALWNAAASTRDTGKPAVVTLGEHDFKYSCSPVVELHAGGEPLPEIRLTVELTAHFKNAQVSLAEGKLTAISPGAASVVARIKYGNATIAERATPNARVPSSTRLEPALDVA